MTKRASGGPWSSSSSSSWSTGFDRLVVEVEAFSLNPSARVCLRRREPAGHQQLHHRKIPELATRDTSLWNVVTRRSLRRLTARRRRTAPGWSRSPRSAAASPCTRAVTSAGEKPLRHALSRVLGVRRHGFGDLIQRQKGEQLEVPLDIAIVGVDPELIELVGTGLGRVEPDVAGLALPELGSRRVGNERKDQCRRSASLRACRSARCRR